jgi:uncharacterized protein (DUF488 family)
MNPVFTIGHSTRSSADFVALLLDSGVQLLIDVRRFPMSKRYPHFNRKELAAALAAAGIGYRHEEILGGRRSPRADSPNSAWRNRQFRGYADHMDSDAFRAAIDRIVADAKTTVQAVMCAEAVPWRCHRNLLADALVARGIDTFHIMEKGKRNPHQLNKDARILPENRLVYGPRVDQIGLL